MSKLKLLITLVLISCLSMLNAQKKTQKSNNDSKSKIIYKDPSASTDDRLKDLLSRMTMAEKIGQLRCPLGWEMYTKNGTKVAPSDKFTQLMTTQHIGMFWATLRADPWTQKTIETGLHPALAAEATNALQRFAVEKTRLGIPLFFAEECPHGHMAIGTTVFPTAIGQSSTWNPELIHRMSTAIATEARLQGGHIGYGPVLDLAQEPRWSRTEETYGEDPVLNSRMGEAMVTGFQGKKLNSGTNVIATLKHFTAYGVPQGGHNGGSISVGSRVLNESYLPPFRAAVKAGALSVMTAYNSIDGVPCSSNAYLLTDVLRKQWGFQGFVVSDLGSIEGIKGSHRVAPSVAVAAKMAIDAGLDVDLGSNAFVTLNDQVANNLVDTTAINEAVARVLRLKFEMGLFENPYVDPKKAATEVRKKEHLALAREVAQQSIILIKNQNNTLPLSKDLKRIAVIGPNADKPYNQLGDYTAPQADGAVITVLKGIQDVMKIKGGEVKYAQGCAIRDPQDDTHKKMFVEAVLAAQESDAIVLVVGGSSARDFKTQYIATGAAVADKNQISDMESGEGFDRSTLDLMGRQLDLIKAIAQVAGSKPLVVVYIQGRPLNMNWVSENVPAVLNAWYPGQEGGHAIADVLWGQYNPAGRLPISIPRSVGQLPVYYNQKNPLPHDYIEGSYKPLYPFGYGLSYTNFAYSELTSTINDKSLLLKFTVQNTGQYDGEEVVQLYIQDEYASVTQANKQLKHFQRVFIKKGESKEVQFQLTEQDLLLLNKDLKWVVEPGSFKIQIGASSDDIRLHSDLNVSDMGWGFAIKLNN